MTKGLDISRAYFEEYGRPMLERDFPEVLPYLAAGLFGSGSECFGFDDEVSLDHDVEPGFMLLLPGEDVVDRRTAFLLERAYAKLPKEYMGLKRSLMNPVGGARHGVVRTADFFREKTGTPDGRLPAAAWLSLPDSSLAEAVNGEIYADAFGEVTAIRERLSFYPEDIFRKKLAGNLLLMAQAGQYNYRRALSHGEEAAAQLAVFEFTKACMAAIFLLNGTYMPFYKWAFRSMRKLSLLALEAELLEYLITTDNGRDMREEKAAVIEGICSDVAAELMVRDLSKASCGDMEKHAYSVNDGIADAEVRNLHILAAV